VAGMGEQIMHLGFEVNVFSRKMPQRICSHRLDNIKIVPKKNRNGGCGLGLSVSV